MSADDVFKHYSHDDNKKLNALKKFIDGNENFYDIFKTELEHTHFYWDDNGLRYGYDDKHIIDKQVYNFNSLGYRAREFSKECQTNTLVFGCSTSFGQGIPEDQTWSSQLAKLKNIEILNMALPGKGVSRYLEDLILYCNNFGKPSNVIILIADLYRLRFLDDTKYHLQNGAKQLVDNKKWCLFQ